MSTTSPSPGLPEDFSLQMQRLLGNDYPIFEKSLQTASPTSIRTNPFKDFERPLGEAVPWCTEALYLSTRPEFVFDPKTVILDYEGLQLEREFYAPVYETETQRSSRLPDFRDLLTWQPDLHTNASGKTSLRFYTSDRTGNFIGIIHGIDANGNASTQVFNIQVTK